MVVLFQNQPLFFLLGWRVKKSAEESCMICGDHAPVASNYVPPKTLGERAAAAAGSGGPGGPGGPGGGAPHGMVYAMPDPGDLDLG